MDASGQHVETERLSVCLNHQSFLDALHLTCLECPSVPPVASAHSHSVAVAVAVAVASNPSGARRRPLEGCACPGACVGGSRCMALPSGACLPWCGPASPSPTVEELLPGSVPLETASAFLGLRSPAWQFQSPCQQQYPWVAAWTQSCQLLLPAHSLAHSVRLYFLVAGPCVLCV